MDFGERVAVSLIEEGDKECLFKDEEVDNPEVEPEDAANDDVASPQENLGSILGRNMGNASHGEAKYLNDAFYKAPKMRRNERRDSTTHIEEGKRIIVAGKKYHYVVAAHHLIPGDESLAVSYLIEFMKEGGEVETAKGTKQIKANIGYCVNGAHNGVWLASNYAFGTGLDKTPAGPWSEYAATEAGFNWATKYMIGATKVVRAQFHDRHTTYSENCLDILTKLATALCVHPDSCKLCERKRKIPPPYSVKAKLYRVSKWLKQKLRWPPETWKLPWMTSDKFKGYMTKNRSDFLDAYDEE